MQKAEHKKQQEDGYSNPPSRSLIHVEDQLKHAEQSRLSKRAYMSAKVRNAPVEPFDFKTFFSKESWRYWIAVSVTFLLVPIIGIYFGVLVHSAQAVVMLLAGLWTWAIFSTAPRRVTRLMEVPPALPQYPVHLNISYPSKNIGDYGIVFFCEGLMHFEGRKTSFTIDSSCVDMAEGKIKKLVERPKGVGKALKMCWKHPLRPEVSGTISFRVYDHVAGVGAHFNAAFKAELLRWMSGEPAFERRILLPPSKPLK